MTSGCDAVTRPNVAKHLHLIPRLCVGIVGDHSSRFFYLWLWQRMESFGLERQLLVTRCDQASGERKETVPILVVPKRIALHSPSLKSPLENGARDLREW